MRVAVIGAGYVGCVTAACLARLGHDVLVVDTDPFKIREIAAGRSPVLEPGLDDLVAEMTAAGRLRAEIAGDLVGRADVFIVCVSTPSLKSGGVDSRPVQRVLTGLARSAAGSSAPLVVVVRSTIAPDRLRQVLEGLPSGHRSALRIVANPEFLRETTAIADFEKPPFVLLGGDDAAALDRVAALYDGIGAPVHRLDLATALLVKYASNAFHALKIAFANEVALMAGASGADPRRVMDVFAEDRILNVSPAYLRPGFAFGGSCLPKDVRALVAAGKELGEPLPLLRSILESNRDRIDRTAASIAGSGARRVALLGLSFKRGTDDVRESPYLLLAEQLVGRGLELRIFDPDVSAERLLGANRQYVEERLPGLAAMLAATIEAAVEGADGLVLCKRVASQDVLRAAAARCARVFDLEYIL